MKRAVVMLLVACGHSEPAPVAPPPPPAPLPSAPVVVASDWAAVTSSAASTACDDAALTHAATALLEREVDVEPLLRKYGSPAVRPRVIRGAAGADLGPTLASLHRANTRCGQASNASGIVAVTAEFLADLDPLPVQSRTGAWLTLSATMNVPARGAKVLVLGPRGAPRSFPTRLDHGKTSASFPLDRPGGFTVQLLADVDGGPRPLLEARVFADVAPSLDEAPAPGENEPSLDRMVAVTRQEEGLAALVRDQRLDALAEAHVERMRARKQVAHELGDGNLADRFEREGLVAEVVGENVVASASLPLAHRALYSSASHRQNLLNAQYTRIGLATATEGDRLYACEVFSSAIR